MQSGPTALTTTEQSPLYFASCHCPLMVTEQPVHTGSLHLGFTMWPVCLDQHQTELG